MSKENPNPKNKIILIGEPCIGKTAIALALAKKFEDKTGKKVLILDNPLNFPPMITTADILASYKPPNDLKAPQKSGKELRRDRRKNDRKSKSLKKNDDF